MNIPNVARTKRSIARRRRSMSGSATPFKAFRSRLSISRYSTPVSRYLIPVSRCSILFLVFTSIQHREAPALSIKGTNLTVGNSNYTSKARAFQSRFSIPVSGIGYRVSSIQAVAGLPAAPSRDGGRWGLLTPLEISHKREVYLRLCMISPPIIEFLTGLKAIYRS